MLGNGFRIVLHTGQNNKNSPRAPPLRQKISIIK